MLDDITANLAWDNISVHGVGLYAIDNSGVESYINDDPFHLPEYSYQADADAPFTDKGYWEHAREEYYGKLQRFGLRDE